MYHLSNEQREDLERELFDFIQEHVIYRVRVNYGEELMSNRDGVFKCNHQLFMMRALMNPVISRVIGRLFWDKFSDIWADSPFQLAAPATNGIALVNAITSVAIPTGVICNGVIVRKEPKSYGLYNKIEGAIIPDLPVLMVDDMVNSGETLDFMESTLHDIGLQTLPQRFTVLAFKRLGNLERIFLKRDFSVRYGKQWDPRTYA